MDIHPQWIVGFVDGEGFFHIAINRTAEMTQGYQVFPEFTVVQHKRDVQVLYALKAHFGCGVVRTNHGDRMAFRVRKLEHLLDIIIPFFEKHQLKTKKGVEFQKFRKALLYMQRGDHLTPEGLEAIRGIKSAMNRMQTKIESDSFGNERD